MSGCPCTLVDPCSETCTCAHPAMRGGCQRCALHGSLDQRIAAATRLAALTPSYLPNVFDDVALMRAGSMVKATIL